MARSRLLGALRGPSVKWELYPPQMRSLIDEDAAAGNVEALTESWLIWNRAKDRGDKPALLRYLRVQIVTAKRNRERWDGAMQ